MGKGPWQIQTIVKARHSPEHHRKSSIGTSLHGGLNTLTHKQLIPSPTLQTPSHLMKLNLKQECPLLPRTNYLAMNLSAARFIQTATKVFTPGTENMLETKDKSYHICAPWVNTLHKPCYADLVYFTPPLQ